MRIYLQVKDVNPPDGFQPRTTINVADDNGGTVELTFNTYEQMYDMARVLQDTADEAVRAHLERRATRWGHLAEEIAADETRQDDYEWPEEVAS